MALAGQGARISVSPTRTPWRRREASSAATSPRDLTPLSDRMVMSLLLLLLLLEVEEEVDVVSSSSSEAGSG